MVKKKKQQKPEAAEQQDWSRLDPNLRKAEIAALEEADQLEASAARGSKGAPAKRARALALRSKVARQLERRREAVALEDRIKDQMAHAQGRRSRMGGVQLLGRDGIVALAESKALTSSQVAAALTYRHCYERQEAGLRVVAHDAVGGGKADPAGLRDALLSVRLRQFERAVLAGDPSGGTLKVLQRVAGEGEPLGGKGMGGNARKAALALLKRALEEVITQIPVRPTKAGLANRGGEVHKTL
jgi:hypothetical protein